MEATVAYPHITKHDGESARLARSPRVRVSMIVRDYLHHGWSVERMCEEYDHLKPAEAHAAMAYYFDHREEIDAEIDAENKSLTESNIGPEPSPAVKRLRALGKL